MSAWDFARWLAGGLFAAFCASGSAAAQDVASFYKGKEVTILVGAYPGGGYDIYARLMSRHLPKHIPGNPTVIVSNMPGAGSNIAADHIDCPPFGFKPPSSDGKRLQPFSCP